MKRLDKESVIGISALLVHAANIDEIYSDKEKDLVRNFIKSYLIEEDVNEILKQAEKVEKNIIQHLWKVIISDDTVDQYESNLMRRVCGLIYFPDKECAEIKLNLLNNQ
jgi:uncharacterized tellurite resistance protein B-like protein